MLLGGFQWLFRLGTLWTSWIVHRVGAFLCSRWMVASWRKWVLHDPVAMVFCSLIYEDEKASPAAAGTSNGYFFILKDEFVLGSPYDGITGQGVRMFIRPKLNSLSLLMYQQPAEPTWNHKPQAHGDGVFFPHSEWDRWWGWYVGEVKRRNWSWLIDWSQGSRLSERYSQDWNPFSQGDAITIKYRQATVVG